MVSKKDVIGKELCSNGYSRSFYSWEKLADYGYRGAKISTIFFKVQDVDVTSSRHRLFICCIMFVCLNIQRNIEWR